MEKETLKIMIIQENFIQSFLADLATFSFLCGSVWFNYTFTGNGKFINVIILIMFFAFLMVKSKSKTFYSKISAINYLED